MAHYIGTSDIKLHVATYVFEAVCRHNYFLGRVVQLFHTSIKQDVHPVTVATLSDQSCHLEANLTIINLEQLQSD